MKRYYCHFPKVGSASPVRWEVKHVSSLKEARLLTEAEIRLNGYQDKFFAEVLPVGSSLPVGVKFSVEITR